VLLPQLCITQEKSPTRLLLLGLLTRHTAFTWPIDKTVSSTWAIHNRICFYLGIYSMICFYLGIYNKHCFSLCIYNKLCFSLGNSQHCSYLGNSQTQENSLLLGQFTTRSASTWANHNKICFYLAKSQQDLLLLGQITTRFDSSNKIHNLTCFYLGNSDTNLLILVPCTTRLLLLDQLTLNSASHMQIHSPISLLLLGQSTHKFGSSSPIKP
jgi:hypothetical protein